MIKKVSFVLGSLGLLSVAGFALAQATPTAVVSTDTTNSQPMVLQIGAKGNVLLRGTVDSVSDTSITVKSYGGDWTINVPTSAEVLPQGVALSSFKQGDFVGVQGAINTSSNWTVDATLVRDWTQRQVIKQEVQQNIQKIKDTAKIGPRNYAGTLSNVSGQTFTLTDSNGTAYTVSLTSGAEIVQKGYRTLDFSQVQNGDSVRVWGTATNSDITASVFRDLSIPR